jgi:hypothetical protein
MVLAVSDDLVNQLVQLAPAQGAQAGSLGW